MKKEAEEHKQIKLVNWIHRTYGDDIWEATHHSPNGGNRSAREGNKFKMMGVRSGFPDLVTYVNTEFFVGLAVELKIDKNKPTKNQLKWQKILNDCGFRVHVCTGLEEAMQAYIDYFGFGDIDEEII